MARNILLGLLGVFGLVSVGCKDFEGPRQVKSEGRPDLPQYTIEEQERRGRARYAIPEDTRMAPKTFVDRPGPSGR